MYIRQLNKMKKLFTGFVLLLPIFSIYASPINNISIGECILFLLIILMIIDRGLRNKSYMIEKNPFWLYLVYAFASTLVSSFILSLLFTRFEISSMVMRVTRDAFYFIVIMIFGSWYFDFKYAKYFLKRVSLVLGIFIIFQFMAYAVNHIYIPNIIPMLKTTVSGGLMGREIIEKYTITAGYDGFVRAAGFFSELAVAAQYISISLLVVLFQESEQTNIKTAIFYSIVMLLTFSANAYVALMVCWVLWGVYSNKENKRNLVKILLLVILFIVGIFFVVNNGATSSVLNRLVELKNGGRTSGSSVVRVLRGITFYNHMPLLYQLLGSGFGNFIQFKEMYNITTIYEVADEYMNTNAYVLVSSGVIGFILYVGTLFRRTMGRTLVSKMIVIIVLVFGLSSSIYSSGQFIIMLLFIMYAPKKGEIL